MSSELFNELIVSSWQTFYMVFVSGLVAITLGSPLGVLLCATRTHGVWEHASFNRVLGLLINIVRSIPFIILLVSIIPLTRFLVGTSIGTTAAIVPLTLGATPFVARIVENALAEVNGGLIEAGFAMGASPFQIIVKVLIPESLSALINGFTVMFVSLVGYSAMAGAIGGGGLGDLAIRYGYQRFNTEIMFITVVLLVAFVQLIQTIGNILRGVYE